MFRCIDETLKKKFLKDREEIEELTNEQGDRITDFNGGGLGRQTNDNG